MSRQITSDKDREINSLFARLTEAVGQIDADDLSRLAQMHAWCEALVGLGKQDRAVLNEHLVARMAQTVQELEGLILGESANAEETLTRIVENVVAAAGSLSQGEPDEPQ